MKGFLCLRTRQIPRRKGSRSSAAAAREWRPRGSCRSSAGYRDRVYEKSWRLGGKGASGRDADGRILEHGLHVWLGFYENAFRMMRECYARGRRRGGANRRTRPACARQLRGGVLSRAAHRRSPDPASGATGGVVRLLPAGEGLPGEPTRRRTATPSRLPATCCAASPAEDADAERHRAAGGRCPGRARPEARSALDEAVDLDFALIRRSRRSC